MWFSDTAPLGTLLLQGQEVKQALYPILFGICGILYNVGGEAADAFRLPDPLGRALVGKGTHADVDTLGNVEQPAKPVANRSALHTHSNNLTVTGVPGGGPFVTSVGHTDSTYQGGVTASGVISISTTTGNPTVGSLAVGGTAGLITGVSRPVNSPAFVVVNFGVVAG